MATIKFETAVEKYNAVMMGAGLEYITIGTRYTEATADRNPDNFTLADMIEMASYWADQYNRYGARDINEADKWERADLRKEKRALVKFVKWATDNKDNIEPKPADEYEIAAAESRWFRDLIEKVHKGDEITLWSERGIYGKQSKVSYDAINGEYVVVSGICFGGRFKTERDLFKNLYTRGHIHY